MKRALHQGLYLAGPRHGDRENGGCFAVLSRDKLIGRKINLRLLCRRNNLVFRTDENGNDQIFVRCLDGAEQRDPINRMDDRRADGGARSFVL